MSPGDPGVTPTPAISAVMLATLLILLPPDTGLVTSGILFGLPSGSFIPFAFSSSDNKLVSLSVSTLSLLSFSRFSKLTKIVELSIFVFIPLIGV